MSDNLGENVKIFDPSKDLDSPSKTIDAIIISGSADFASQIARITKIDGLNLNINVVQTFTSAKKGLQHLIRWHTFWEESSASSQKELKNTPVKGKPVGLVRPAEKPKSKELPFPKLLIFFEDSEDNDFSGINFIQILHRTGITVNHQIFVVLFIEQHTSTDFREFAQAVGISFIYDIDTRLEKLLNYFEVIRCNFIDANIGCVIDDSYCNKQGDKTYGPYFSISMTTNDGKKKMVSLGLTLDIKPYEFVREIPSTWNLYQEKEIARKKGSIEPAK